MNESELDNKKAEILRHISTAGAGFRNPISRIFGVLPSIRKTISEFLPEDAVCMERLSVIEQSSYELLRSLRNYMEYTRLNADLAENHVQKIELNGFIQEFFTSAAELLQEQGYTLSCQTQRSLILCDTDPEKLSLILLNLLSNACIYTLEDKHIEILTAAQDDNYQISIRGHGCGMNEFCLAHVFDPYFSYDPVSGDSAGAGIGMTVVKQLCEQIEGTCTIESTPGAGTTVTLTFPVRNMRDISPALPLQTYLTPYRTGNMSDFIVFLKSIRAICK